MSIIRQRTKNLIISGIIGALIMAIVTISVFVLMQGRIQNLKNEMSKMVKVPTEEEVVEKEDMYILSNSIQAGEIIKSDDIKLLSVEQGVTPENAIKDKKDIVGNRLRVDLPKNMPITSNLLFGEKDIDDDIRIQEFRLLFIPTKLQEKDFVDIRISFPNGEDYIVLSKKQVQDLERLEQEGDISEALWLHLSEEEILRISSAIVDAYLHEGSKLYAISYVVPEVQEAAKVTYPVNEDVYKLMLEDPNIVNVAFEELENEKREILEENLNIFMGEDEGTSNSSTNSKPDTNTPPDEMDEFF
ncbi:MAG: SAF domain-containing protein [Eubacteriales bacterium]